MSTETILARMMSDPAFAESVFTDTEKALAGYNLSAEDLSKFKGLTRAHFQAVSTENRQSMVLTTGPNGDPTDPTNTTRNHNETLLIL